LTRYCDVIALFTQTYSFYAVTREQKIRNNYETDERFNVIFSYKSLSL